MIIVRSIRYIVIVVGFKAIKKSLLTTSPNFVTVLMGHPVVIPSFISSACYENRFLFLICTKIFDKEFK